LTPSGFGKSEALGVSGDSQVGYAGTHAFLWHGTAASAVDLHPEGFENSVATGVSGATQVGHGRLLGSHPRFTHALLWNGTPDSVVDLNPPQFLQSEAHGVSGASQVGYGYNTPVSFHALLWHGTATSAVDLHPTGFDSSYALEVSGQSQVGWGFGPATGNRFHAVLWHGTAASAVDLTPGYLNAAAYGVSGDAQVGFGSNGAYSHALLWHGTPESTIDLHPFLSGLGPNLVASAATGIDENGSIVGHAFDDSGRRYPVLWMPIPEPRPLALLACGFAAGMVVHARRRRALVRVRPSGN
jgi:uncharacterized membrane protein